MAAYKRGIIGTNRKSCKPKNEKIDFKIRSALPDKISLQLCAFIESETFLI